jgi:hypothetical protein
MRAKFLAAIVSAVAPQRPTFWGSPSFLEGGTRQGPIAQFLQQLPSAPMGQGFMDSARSYTVDISSSRARSIIFCVASHTVSFFWTESFFGLLALLSFFGFVTFFSLLVLLTIYRTSLGDMHKSIINESFLSFLT